jgi:phage terminase large subunit
MSGRYRVVQGGMRAGKTFAILQYFIALAEQTNNILLTVTSNTYPSLRLGAMRDFEIILEATGHWQYFDENKTTSTWTCRATGSKIEFVGLDEPLKARGPARHHLFVNEANRIKYSVFEALALRTSGIIFLDYNPSAKFWAHDEIVKREDASFEILTYLDNEELPPAIRADIESRDRNSNWWKVYGLGQIGELEGNILKGWTFLDQLPEQSELLAYGLDFGFKPDPCALVSLHKTDDALGAVEEWVQYELTSKDIIREVQKVVPPDKLVIADNARPEIIREMQMAGIQVIPCVKQENIAGQKVGLLGQLEMMADYKFLAVGEILQAEYLDYHYAESRDGTFVSKVPDGQDHCLDALRYVWYWTHRKYILETAMAAILKEYK